MPLLLQETRNFLLENASEINNNDRLPNLFRQFLTQIENSHISKTMVLQNKKRMPNRWRHICLSRKIKNQSMRVFFRFQQYWMAYFIDVVHSANSDIHCLILTLFSISLSSSRSHSSVFMQWAMHHSRMRMSNTALIPANACMDECVCVCNVSNVHLKEAGKTNEVMDGRPTHKHLAIQIYCSFLCTVQCKRFFITNTISAFVHIE